MRIYYKNYHVFLQVDNRELPLHPDTNYQMNQHASLADWALAAILQACIDIWWTSSLFHTGTFHPHGTDTIAGSVGRSKWCRRRTKSICRCNTASRRPATIRISLSRFRRLLFASIRLEGTPPPWPWLPCPRRLTLLGLSLTRLGWMPSYRQALHVRIQGNGASLCNGRRICDQSIAVVKNYD